MAHTRAIAKIVGFFRGGYPRTGDVPLERRLSDEDVLVVAKVITDAEPPILYADIRLALTRRLGEAPLSEHVDQLIRELTDTGWLVVDASGRPVAQTLPNQQTEAGNRIAAPRRPEGRMEPR